MKSLKNMIFTILMMSLVLIVYINIDSLSDFLKNLLIRDDEIIVEDGNLYTRDFKFISFSQDEDYIPYNESDIRNIYFNILNNGWDSFTFYCPIEYDNCINDVIGIADNKELLSKINNYVHPYNSFKDISTKVYENKLVVSINKKYSLDSINEINEKVKTVISSLKIDNLSDREKIEVIHNYIINNTVYDNSLVDGKSNYDSTSAYGSLIEGYSVCSGYSDAMAVFLDIIDIPNIKVSSDNHIWNLVYIDNKWLHLDLTWDDTENTKYSNNYFLITKERLFMLDNKEHNFDSDFFLEAI